MEAQPVVRLEGVAKSYRLGRVQVPALVDVTLEVASGDFLALAGPSGSGKTTLLNLIGCIDKPDAGRVVVDGVDVTRVPLYRLAGTRAEVLGFIFQTFNLIPVLTAFENVEYPLLLRGVGRRERRERALRWLEQVGLAAQARQRPDQLSGGQRQRVAIARAMAGDPKLVLADEPTANLDSDTAAKILDLLQRLNAETRTTFVFATHDPALIARAPRCIRMHDGALVRNVIPSVARDLEGRAARIANFGAPHAPPGPSPSASLTLGMTT